MSNDIKPARVRGADYCDAYDALPDKHGYTRERMLVVLKAYERYLDDVKAGKDEDVCGLVDDFYDIGPVVFLKSGITVRTTDLVDVCPEFWDCANGTIKLSAEGREFVKCSKLFECAENILGGVTQLRRA